MEAGTTRTPVTASATARQSRRRLAGVARRRGERTKRETTRTLAATMAGARRRATRTRGRRDTDSQEGGEGAEEGGTIAGEGH